MISDQLVLDILGHALEWVVGTLEFGVLEFLEHLLDLAFHLEVVGFGEAWVEWVSLEGATATDTGGVDVFTFGVQVGQQVSFAFAQVDFGLLLVGSESVVVILDQRVEQGLEESVGLGIWSVDTDSGVQVGNTGLDDVQKGGSELGALVLELVNNFLGEVLLQEGVAFWGALKIVIISYVNPILVTKSFKNVVGTLTWSFWKPSSIFWIVSWGTAIFTRTSRQLNPTNEQS